MKLDEVKGIAVSYDEKEVNIYLREGYKILKIISSKRVEGEHEIVCPAFVLGKAN